MPPLSENDIAYLKADQLEAGLRQAERNVRHNLTWHRPAGYQRHLAAQDDTNTAQVATAA